MDAAINMINEFMPEGRLIVYTEGKSFPRSDVYANGTGTCKDAPIVVLTDEISASASEIFSGAIQDNDRGTIIGRRTYGKGLVQTQMSLSDGSEMRLTIAVTTRRPVAASRRNMRWVIRTLTTKISITDICTASSTRPIASRWMIP